MFLILTIIQNIFLHLLNFTVCNRQHCIRTSAWENIITNSYELIVPTTTTKSRCRWHDLLHSFIERSISHASSNKTFVRRLKFSFFLCANHTNHIPRMSYTPSGYNIVQETCGVHSSLAVYRHGQLDRIWAEGVKFHEEAKPSRVVDALIRSSGRKAPFMHAEFVCQINLARSAHIIKQFVIPRWLAIFILLYPLRASFRTSSLLYGNVCFRGHKLALDLWLI